MRILADRYLFRIAEELPNSFQVDLFDPASGFPQDAVEYDALLVRTVTPLNARTLPRAGNLKFVATGTAGTDHVDSEYLKELGIHFVNAQGCNANAVAEYVFTLILWWSEERQLDLSRKKVGIVGCGNTGGRVAGYLAGAGIESVLYDPPKAEREPEFTSSSVDELLKCDLITFHTPLTEGGSDPTLNLCGNEWLSAGWELLINTSRGGVVNEEELIRAQKRGDVKDMVTDVWTGEPRFSTELLHSSLIATPHIAGYSSEAKWMASKMVADQLAQSFGEQTHDSGWNPAEMVSDSQKERLEWVRQYGTLRAGELLWKLSSIEEYDRKLRSISQLDEKERAQEFALLRSGMPLRSEFRTLFQLMSEEGPLPEIARLFYPA